MIAAELRGGNKPSLNEALDWIGWRVDDIYGADVGRLDDVWIDPGTGSPRWLLVKEGRFSGRSTLIPFEDATAGAGHVWVPYERDVVRAAPEVQAGAPLTQELETALRAHYSATAPRSAARRPAAGVGEAATIRFGRAEERPRSGVGGHLDGVESPAPRPAVPYSEPQPRMPERPAPPVEAPRRSHEEPPPPPGHPAGHGQDAREADALRYRNEEELVYPAPGREPGPPAPRPEGDPYRYAEPPDPAQEHLDALRDLAAAGGTHFVEIELSGELSIRGELRSIRVTPHDRRPR